jgi:hypothetical protein
MKMRQKAAVLLFLLISASQPVNSQPVVATDTWSYSYSGPYNGIGILDFVQTANGGYVILAYTQESIDSERNCWLLGINAKGAVEWNKTIPISR